jgi:hypothetical protein
MQIHAHTHIHTCTFPFDCFTYHIMSNKNKANIEHLQKSNANLLHNTFLYQLIIWPVSAWLTGVFYDICSICFNLSIKFSHVIKLLLCLKFLQSKLQFQLNTVKIQLNIIKYNIKLNAVMLCPTICILILLHAWNFGIRYLVCCIYTMNEYAILYMLYWLNFCKYNIVAWKMYNIKTEVTI